MFSPPALLAVSALVVLAAVVSNDAFVPPITSPTADTKWKVGAVVKVTWDTSDAPSTISNKGSIVLHKSGIPVQNLADGFDFGTGSIDVTVPNDVEPGKDYTITLDGDSGHVSPTFEIIA